MAIFPLRDLTVNDGADADKPAPPHPDVAAPCAGAQASPREPAAAAGIETPDRAVAPPATPASPVGPRQQRPRAAMAPAAPAWPLRIPTTLALSPPPPRLALPPPYLRPVEARPVADAAAPPGEPATAPPARAVPVRAVPAPPPPAGAAMDPLPSPPLGRTPLRAPAPPDPASPASASALASLPRPSPHHANPTWPARSGAPAPPAARGPGSPLAPARPSPRGARLAAEAPAQADGGGQPLGAAEGRPAAAGAATTAEAPAPAKPAPPQPPPRPDGWRNGGAGLALSGSARAPQGVSTINPPVSRAVSPPVAAQPQVPLAAFEVPVFEPTPVALTSAAPPAGLAPWPDTLVPTPPIWTPVEEAGAKRPLLKRAVRACAIALVALVTSLAALIVLYRWFDPPTSMLMLGQRLGGTTITQHWVPIEQIASTLQLAVIVSEDSRFCRHRGIDWEELETAIDQSVDGVARGGSTIAMQTVKNLFLWPAKSYLRKAIELPLAYAVDAVWSKRRLLEIYLNIAEWGPGVFGAEAAARYHFRKPASLLTAREAALLAASLPNPFERRAGAPGPGTQRLAANLMLRMRAGPGMARCLRAGGGL